MPIVTGVTIPRLLDAVVIISKLKRRALKSHAFELIPTLTLWKKTTHAYCNSLRKTKTGVCLITKMQGNASQGNSVIAVNGVEKVDLENTQL